MKERVWPWALLLLGVSVLLFAVPGCELFEPKDRWFVEAFFEEWANAKDLNPVTDEGELDPEGARNLGSRVVTNSTGDEEADAALDRTLIADIVEAEKLMEVGLLFDDDERMEEAIQMRPNDWSLRHKRAVKLLNRQASLTGPSQRDVERAARDLEKAKNLVGPDPNERIRYAKWGIRELERTKTKLARMKLDERVTPALWRNGPACRLVFARLGHYYGVLAQETGSDSDRRMAEQYRRDVGQCPKD